MKTFSTIFFCYSITDKLLTNFAKPDFKALKLFWFRTVGTVSMSLCVRKLKYFLEIKKYLHIFHMFFLNQENMCVLQAFTIKFQYIFFVHYRLSVLEIAKNIKKKINKNCLILSCMFINFRNIFYLFTFGCLIYEIFYSL